MKKAKPDQGPVPAPRETTPRQKMLELLYQGPMNARDLSQQVGVAEREVYSHLEHIRSSLHREESSLKILPAECRDCGFVFSKRERLKKPGRCPRCRSESISQPEYVIA